MWLSLAERCVRDAEAAGSNPVTPIVQGLRGSPDKAGHKILGRGIFSVSGCYFTPGTLLFCIEITRYHKPVLLVLFSAFYKDLLTKLYNKLYNNSIKTAKGYFMESSPPGITQENGLVPGGGYGEGKGKKREKGKGNFYKI